MGHNADQLEKEAQAQSFYEQAVHLKEIGELMIKPSGKREQFLAAAGLFKKAGSYQDARDQERECLEKADAAGNEAVRKQIEAVQRSLADPAYREYDKLITQLEEISSGAEDENALEAQRLLEICRGKKKKQSGRRTVRRVIAVLLAAALAGGLIWCFSSGFINYAKGYIYRRAGMDSYALASYRKLGDRFGGNEMYAACELEALSRAGTGESVSFGDLKWTVLEKDAEEQTVTMIASLAGEGKALSAVPFDSEMQEDREIEWETSSLRAWLNGEFLAESFSEKERSHIEPFVRPASENEAYGTAWKEETEDYLAPPDMDEMGHYADTLTQEGDCWLRTPGHDGNTVAFASGSGRVVSYGLPADQALSVRPVIRVRCGQ